MSSLFNVVLILKVFLILILIIKQFQCLKLSSSTFHNFQKFQTRSFHDFFKIWKRLTE